MTNHGDSLGHGGQASARERAGEGQAALRGLNGSSAVLGPGRVKRLVVVLPSWVGDAVMATPVLRALRLELTEARIIAVVRPGLNELLAGSPWVDEYVVSRNSGVFGPMKLGRMMRQHEPDAGLLLPNSFRSALSLWLSGCRVRVGYARDGRSLFLTHPIAAPLRNRPVPAVEYYAALAEQALGLGRIDRTIQLHTTEAEQRAADELLRSVGERFIVLNPGANKVEKRWPAERFAAVGDELIDRYGVDIVVNGSPGEAAIVDAVIIASRHRERYINLAQRGVRLGSLKAVLERAALLITNDTGPRHIAAALGTPIVSLFGPTDHRWTTLEGGRVREVRLLAEPFLPEERMADEHPEVCDIERIRVGDVVAAARGVIGQG